MNRYTLNDSTFVRKECFGALVCNTQTGEFSQFNQDAFEILKELKTPLNLQELENNLEEQGMELSQDFLFSFLEDLRRDNIVTFSEKPLRSKVLFEDCNDIREDCLIAPASATLYITEWCSKQCLHCVVRSSPYVETKNELSVDSWKKILDKLCEFGVFSLVFTGGEPLSKQGIFEILDYADDLGFMIKILTDYDQLTDSHVEKIKQYKGLEDFQVSLDGGKEVTHDYIRGKGSFRKAIKRLQLLKNHGIPYTISTVIGKHNINELSLITQIAQQYNAEYFYLNPLAPYGRAKKNLANQILDKKQLEWLGEEYSRLAREGIVDPGNPFWAEQESDVSSAFTDSLHAISLGVHSFSFDSQGNCYLDSKLKSEELLLLGNALSDSIKNLWYNPKLDNLRLYSRNMEATFAPKNEVFEL